VLLQLALEPTGAASNPFRLKKLHRRSLRHPTVYVMTDEHVRHLV